MQGTHIALMVLALVATAMPSLGQDPAFSGTWRLDRDASEFPEFGGRGVFGGRRGGPGGGRGGPGGGRGGPGGGAQTLVIEQSRDALIIDHQSARGSRVVSYQLDGRASMNPGPRGDQTTTSHWEGTTLVTEGTLALSTPRGDFSMDLVERLELDDNGQTLTIESTRTTPRGAIAMTLVYRR